MQIRLGLTITDERQIDRGRPDDGVDFVTLRTTLLTMPRAAGARRQAERLRRCHPAAQFGVYAWHYLTHAAEDPLAGRGTRTLAAEGPVGHLREGTATAQAWETTLTALDAMEGTHVVLRTPPSFAPGSLSRRRLGAFVQMVRAAAADRELELVWEAEGMWTAEEVLAISAEHGLRALLPAFSTAGRVDEYDPGLEPFVWRRVGGMGSRPELTPAQAEILAFELGDRDDDEPPVTLVFEGERGVANLRKVRRALEA